MQRPPAADVGGRTFATPRRRRRPLAVMPSVAVAPGARIEGPTPSPCSRMLAHVEGARFERAGASSPRALIVAATSSPSGGGGRLLQGAHDHVALGTSASSASRCSRPAVRARVRPRLELERFRSAVAAHAPLARVHLAPAQIRRAPFRAARLLGVYDHHPAAGDGRGGPAFSLTVRSTAWTALYRMRRDERGDLFLAPPSARLLAFACCNPRARVGPTQVLRTTTPPSPRGPTTPLRDREPLSNIWRVAPSPRAPA